MDHDQQLHEAVVDVTGSCRLNDENILISHRFAHGDTGLLVGVVEAHGLCDIDAQPALGAMAVSIFAVANHKARDKQLKKGDDY